MRVFDVKSDKLNYKFDYHLEEKANITNKLNENKSIGIDDVRRIALWKYNRIIQMDEDSLELIFRLASDHNASINDESIQKCISVLVNTNGIGYPLASAILKFINPAIFPIIDVRAYRALYGKKITKYTLEDYIDYTKKIYEIAEILSLPVENVDEQLYEYDKQNNGKI